MAGMLFIVICYAAALLALAIFLQPNSFIVRREAVINAPPRQVFAAINNLHDWESWSPWAKLDPNAETHYEGPTTGPGAAFEWSGDKKVGAGRLTIVDSLPSERVDLKLDMRKPFAVTNDVTFFLAPDGELTEGRWLARALGFGGESAARKTHIVWSMSGDASLMSRAMNIFMSRDKMIGDQFEKGLENLGAHLSK
ncbi:MAG: SRPBCC family protein [Alphaproteobacteria bacterium]|nr:SRPBCC family protein [Alphaproteobacteria bacterium]MBM3641804.1 SRPBCC family protein [Alphaproteobacteria bacterium]